MDVLRTCVHGASTFTINSGVSLTVTGGPASSNSLYRRTGTTYGNVEALSQTGTGTVTGTITVPAASKTMPSPTILDTYKAMATQIAYPGAIVNGAAMGPGYNSLGAANPNGIYYIDTSGANITFNYCRIYGTLIVKAVGMTVTFSQEAFLQNASPDNPVLLVDANLTLSITSSLPLSEGDRLDELQPAGLPVPRAVQHDEDRYLSRRNPRPGSPDQEPDAHGRHQGCRYDSRRRHRNGGRQQHGRVRPDDLQPSAQRLWRGREHDEDTGRQLDADGGLGCLRKTSRAAWFSTSWILLQSARDHGGQRRGPNASAGHTSPAEDR